MSYIAYKVIVMLYAVYLKVFTRKNTWQREYCSKNLKRMKKYSLYRKNLNDYNEKYLKCNSSLIRKRMEQLSFTISYLVLGILSYQYEGFNFNSKGWRWRNHHIGDFRIRFLRERLNTPSEEFKSFTDKPFFNQWYRDYIGRKCCSLSGTTDDEYLNLFKNSKKVIAKPTKSFGGTGIIIVDLSCSDPIAVLRNLKKRISVNETTYMVEEFITQTGFCHDVFPNAVNTVRVITVRKGQQVDCLEAYFRCGTGQMEVDNWSQGGIVFPVTIETGILREGHGKFSRNVQVHPDSKIRVQGEKIPMWNDILKLAIELHKKAPDGINLMGWDICATEDNLYVIEGNSRPGFTEIIDPNRDCWGAIKRYL